MCRVIYHPKYQAYDLGPEHPFSPLRVAMLLDLLHTYEVQVDFLEPLAATQEMLLEIHDPQYIQIIQEASAGKKIAHAEHYGLGTADNPIKEGMAEGALFQVGGTVLGAKLLMEDQTKKVLQLGGGFHHAHPGLAAGFCLYNDLALAIKKFTKFGWHVAYLDIDVHHGDGVQEMFYSNDKVMTISLHESGEYLFPGTGWIHELGRGMGRALKLNIPLEPFTEGTSYLKVVEGVVEPALSWFRPDVLVVQAGADAHFSDPLADLLLTTYDYERLFHKIIEMADQSCKGRILFTLGGGYAMAATVRIWAILYYVLHGWELPDRLPAEWRQRWQKKIGKPLPEYLHDRLPAYDPIPRKEEIERANRQLIQRIMDSVAADWL